MTWVKAQTLRTSVNAFLLRRRARYCSFVLFLSIYLGSVSSADIRLNRRTGGPRSNLNQLLKPSFLIALSWSDLFLSISFPFKQNQTIWKVDVVCVCVGTQLCKEHILRGFQVFSCELSFQDMKVCRHGLASAFHIRKDQGRDLFHFNCLIL